MRECTKAAEAIKICMERTSIPFVLSQNFQNAIPFSKDDEHFLFSLKAHARQPGL
jgi:hypothetical protein